MGVLDQIIVGVREDLAERVARVSRADLERQVGDVAPALEVLSRLRGGPVSVISEVKRSSPSKGHLATIDDPAALAARYQDCLLYTSPSPRDGLLSRMPSSA